MLRVLLENHLHQDFHLLLAIRCLRLFPMVRLFLMDPHFHLLLADLGHHYLLVILTHRPFPKDLLFRLGRGHH